MGHQIRHNLIAYDFKGAVYLALVVRRLGQLAVDCPDIVELDVNPLLATETGAVALDARARIEPQ